MDFTREPVIETVITPKEGCKLVVRSSKSSGQEEYFVDAVEVVSFGHSLFFRSLERPKAFLVPVSDYEVLEVRETRMVLKNVGVDRSIKIGGGRETVSKAPKEAAPEREVVEPVALPSEELAPLATEPRLDKKRGRRHYRRRRGREEPVSKEGEPLLGAPLEEGEVKQEPQMALGTELEGPFPEAPTSLQELETSEAKTPSLILSSILPPPPTLISDTIARYKEMFKGAFIVPEERAKDIESAEQPMEPEPPHKEAWISDEAEEELFRHRASSLPPEESAGHSTESPEAKEGHVPNSN